MKKYSVTWTKMYYAYGEEIVYAHDRVGAEKIVEDKIGDLERPLGERQNGGPQGPLY